MGTMEAGEIGELVGGVAVLATLLYLATQVRQNTAAIQETTRLAMSEQIEGFAEFLIAEEAVRRSCRGAPVKLVAGRTRGGCPECAPLPTRVRILP